MMKGKSADKNHHAAQLIQAASKVEKDQIKKGKQKIIPEAKNHSDLVKMQVEIGHASAMSNKAKKRRASVIFKRKGKASFDPQVELKPLGDYHSKVGARSSYIMAL